MENEKEISIVADEIEKNTGEQPTKLFPKLNLSKPWLTIGSAPPRSAMLLWWKLRLGLRWRYRIVGATMAVNALIQVQDHEQHFPVFNSVRDFLIPTFDLKGYDRYLRSRPSFC